MIKAKTIVPKLYINKSLKLRIGQNLAGCKQIDFKKHKKSFDDLYVLTIGIFVHDIISPTEKYINLRDRYQPKIIIIIDDELSISFKTEIRGGQLCLEYKFSAI